MADSGRLAWTIDALSEGILVATVTTAEDLENPRAFVGTDHPGGGAT